MTEKPVRCIQFAPRPDVVPKRHSVQCVRPHEHVGQHEGYYSTRPTTDGPLVEHSVTWRTLLVTQVPPRCLNECPSQPGEDPPGSGVCNKDLGHADDHCDLHYDNGEFTVVYAWENPHKTRDGDDRMVAHVECGAYSRDISVKGLSVRCERSSGHVGHHQALGAARWLSWPN